MRVHSSVPTPFCRERPAHYAAPRQSVRADTQRPPQCMFLLQGGADMLANPRDVKLLLEDLPPSNVLSNTYLHDYEVSCLFGFVCALKLNLYAHVSLHVRLNLYAHVSLYARSRVCLSLYTSLSLNVCLSIVSSCFIQMGNKL